jgi:hypothetical protein
MEGVRSLSYLSSKESDGKAIFLSRFLCSNKSRFEKGCLSFTHVIKETGAEKNSIGKRPSVKKKGIMLKRQKRRDDPGADLDAQKGSTGGEWVETRGSSSSVKRGGGGKGIGKRICIYMWIRKRVMRG